MEQVIKIGLPLLSILFIGRSIKMWISFLKFHKSVEIGDVVQLKLKRYYRYKYDKLILALVLLIVMVVSYRGADNYYLAIFLTTCAIDSLTQFYCMPVNYLLFNELGVSMNYLEKYKCWTNLEHIIDDEDGDNLVLKFSKGEITIPLLGMEGDLKIIVEQIDKYRPDIRQRN